MLCCVRPSRQLWEADGLDLEPEQADRAGLQQPALPVFLTAGHGQHVGLRPGRGRQDQVWQGDTPGDTVI